MPSKYFKYFSISDMNGLFRDSCFSRRILGEALESEAGSHPAVRGRLIGLAERLGVAVAESSDLDAELRSEGIRKFG